MNVRIKKILISVGLLLVIGFLCIIFINPIQINLNLFSYSKEKSVIVGRTKSLQITPKEAINIVAKKYGFEKYLLECKGIDKKTGFYIINLSPGNSKGAAGRTFYVNPSTSEIKDPFEEFIKDIKEKN
jgi:hypothetical protein